MIELGIDEAGRGPVLGPLVMAGVWVPDDKASLLIEWGITDSKKFGSQKKGKEKRQALAEKIKSEFAYKIVIARPSDVDKYVNVGGLNRLEREMAKEIMASDTSDRVILDGVNLFKSLTNDHVFARDKADNDYISVAAASILAKDKRDYEFDALITPFVGEFGTIGGNGYANARTLEFLTWYKKKYDKLPEFYRASYKWKAMEGD